MLPESLWELGVRREMSYRDVGWALLPVQPEDPKPDGQECPSYGDIFLPLALCRPPGAGNVVAISFVLGVLGFRLVGVVAVGQFFEGLHGGIGFQQLQTLQSQLCDGFAQRGFCDGEFPRQMPGLLLSSQCLLGSPPTGRLQRSQFVQCVKPLVRDPVSLRAESRLARLPQRKSPPLHIAFGLANLQHGVESKRHRHDKTLPSPTSPRPFGERGRG